MNPVIAALPGSAPAQLGGHRILGVLGSGGMGTVYLARRHGRPVALKTIRPELLRDTHLRERFTREAVAAAAVRSPFVAAVLGSSTTEGVPWLAAEFVPGATLGDAVPRHGPLPVPAACVLAAALGRALTALGRAGVVHRDLKPSHVILGAASRTKCSTPSTRRPGRRRGPTTRAGTSATSRFRTRSAASSTRRPATAARRSSRWTPTSAAPHALSTGAVGMSDGADRLVQHGNRLYAQKLDRIAAIPLD